MMSHAKRDLIDRFLAGALSRRQFVAGAMALGLSAATVDAALAAPAGGPGTAVRAAQGGEPEAGPSHTYPLTDEKVTFRVLAPAHPQVEDYATNTFTRWYEERTNVHVEWEIVPEQEAQTNLNLRLASGDYPDLIMSFNPTPALQMLYGAQGVFLPLNDLIEQHGIHFKAMVDEYPLVLDAITAPTGDVYALPYVTYCYHCLMSQKLWIYQPWLDALGLAMPATLDEYADVLRAFKAQDANANGQADEIPLVTATAGALSLDHFFMNAFIYNSGATANRLILRDSQVTAVYAQPEWRQGVSYLAGLAAEGLIAPESFTQDQDQLRRLGSNPDAPIVGTVPALWQGVFMDIQSSLEAGRWTDYVAVPPLEGPDGLRLAALNTYDPIRQGSFIITNACQDPALAFRWADGFYEIETMARAAYGEPGTHWRWAEEGEVGLDGEPAVWKRLASYGQVQNVCWLQTGPQYRSNAFRLGEAVNEGEVNQAAILYRETKEKYVPYQQPEEWTLPPMWFTEEQAQQVAEIGSTITGYVEQTLAAAITGQFDVEGQWEEYLGTLDGMGLEQYLQIHQDAYDGAQDR